MAEELEALNERLRAIEALELDLTLQRAELQRATRELEQLLEKARVDALPLLAREFASAASDASYQAISGAEHRAKQILLTIMERRSAAWTQAATTVIVKLPSDDVKGRLIGREGRNFKAFEQVTGAELVIDETPSAVTLSCMDPRRRMLAHLTLTNLILDGRIHPARIEEIYAQVESEFDDQMPDMGAEAAERARVPSLSAEVLSVLGALKFRTSFGQNVLEHSVEVSHLAAVLAAELGADPDIARRAGLLHDIGKALGPEWGPAHALAGKSYLEACGESEAVCLAVGAHHYDIQPSTPEAQVVIVADSISGSRPGARSAQEATHLARMAKLESLAKSLNGVERAFAYDSGREVRVFVDPGQVDDLQAARVAKQVARLIRAEREYPGPVKVTVIRETRAIEVSE